MLTTLLDHEAIRHRSAAPPSPGRAHLRDLRTGDPPSPPPGPPRRAVALLLALAAHRLDRETAHRTIVEAWRRRGGGA
ncbi:MAG: hypothetical protein IRZ32_00540 [Solirubrobacteraceae bacterium]|nr:hypothetical protein [Solirubrobacteraceae bacterium]